MNQIDSCISLNITEEMGSSAHNHKYFCVFCLETTIWKTEMYDSDIS